MSLTYTRVSEYVFSTSSLYSEDIWNGFYAACIRLGTSLFNTLAAALMIITYALILILKLSIMVFPHFIFTAKAVIEFHRTKLTKYDLLVEFVVATLVVLFLLFRKRMAARWEIFEKAVARRSKAAAAAAPHVAFFTSALIFSIAARKFLVYLAAPAVLPVITLIIPICTTLRYLQRENSDLFSKNQTILKQMLSLWVVVAAYHTVATGLSLVPFLSRTSLLTPYSKCLAVVVMIWIQLSHKFTAIVFDTSVPFLKYLASKIPSSNFGATQGSSFISMLKMMGIMNAKYETFFKSLLQDTVIVLIASCFAFSPWPISYVGVVLVSLLFPAFKSSNVIMGRIKDGSNIVSTVFWLQYWTCWGTLWSLRCFGFHIWPSAMLLVTLWLQHSYFQGAAWLFSAVTFNWAAIQVRHHRMQQEKLKESDEETRMLLSVDGEGDSDVKADVNVIECDVPSKKNTKSAIAICVPISSPTSRKNRTSASAVTAPQKDKEKEKEKVDSGRRSGAEDDQPEETSTSNRVSALDDSISSTYKKDS